MLCKHRHSYKPSWECGPATVVILGLFYHEYLQVCIFTEPCKPGNSYLSIREIGEARGLPVRGWSFSSVIPSLYLLIDYNTASTTEQLTISVACYWK